MPIGIAPASSRTGFNSATLIRFLEDIHAGAAADVVDSKTSFAERLGQWLGWTDAIALSAALNTGDTTNEASAGPGIPKAARAVVNECLRLHRELMHRIAADDAFPAPDSDQGAAVDFSAYRHSYVAQQRGMSTRIAPMRAQLRSALTAASPRLGQLAALDAVFDAALGGRERQALAVVPVLLERYFERQPPGAPEPIDKSLRRMLQAELELRWQPMAGMLAALGHEGLEAH